MSSWRVAKSLLKLRDQIDAAAPDRAKGNDGTIGDASHAARSSDHNPWVKDHGIGVVTAMDITHDPKRGVDTYRMADELLASRDRRIKYIISNRKIASPTIEPRWAWRPYKGINPHDHHVHISVKSEREFYDDESPWHFGQLVPDPSVPPNEEIVRRGDVGQEVKKIQKLLHLPEDGKFGKKVQLAVIEFQKLHGLIADGVVGPMTWSALLAA